MKQAKGVSKQKELYDFEAAFATPVLVFDDLDLVQ